MGLFGPPDEDLDYEQKLLERHNPYDWVACQVTLPGLELTIESASPWARGFATGAFGLMGLAVTSGVNQSYEHLVLNTHFRIAEKGVVIFQACKDESDLRIPWDNIVQAFYVKTHEGQNSLRIILLKNQPITIWFNRINLFQSEYIHYSRAVARIINEHACGVSPENEGW